MNNVTAPSRAPASPTNLLTSPVRSIKPRPDVSTVSSEVTAGSAVTADSAVRNTDLGEVIEYLSMHWRSVSGRPGARRDPYAVSSRLDIGAEAFCNMIAGVMGPGLRRATRGSGNRLLALNLAGDVLLHPVGHLDQPPPCLFQKRHHAIHVLIARQRDLNLARAIGPLGLGFL